MDRLEKLEWEVAQLKRITKGFVRYGKVVEVDGKKVRVEFDEGEKSNWLDYKIKSGKVKITASIHVGERVEIISANGDTVKAKLGHWAQPMIAPAQKAAMTITPLKLTM